MCKGMEELLDRSKAQVIIEHVDNLAESVGHEKALELLKISNEEYRAAKEILFTVSQV